jgi:transcriptional regulator GlxA family with amidase domain
MKIAFVIYNGMTSLDFIGVYDPLTRLKGLDYRPDLHWDICAHTEEVADNTGLRMVPTKVKEPLGAYDIMVVSGGFSSRKLIDDPDFITWLKTGQPCPLKVSVCTGSLLLGAAGFLKGKKATTHFNALDLLNKFCSQVVKARIVDEGEVITAGGVTSSIDLGLYLCQKLAGPEVRERIRSTMDYPRDEFYKSGSPDEKNT